MGGKALIGGTAYDITGGKTLIGGTVYDITKGKTLIGGTAYDIEFGEAEAKPTLATLFADMTLAKDCSINAAAAAAISMSTSPLTGGPYYVFAFCDGQMSIWKYKNGVLSGPLQKTWSTTANAGACVLLDSGYLHHAFVSGNTYSKYAANGATLVAVRFPSFSTRETDIDDLFKAAQFMRVTGRNTTSTGYVRTNTDKSAPFYFGTKFKMWGSSYTGSGEDTAGLTIFTGDGTTWTALKQVTPNWAGAHVASGYLTMGSCYGGSIVKQSGWRYDFELADINGNGTMYPLTGGTMALQDWYNSILSDGLTHDWFDSYGYVSMIYGSTYYYLYANEDYSTPMRWTDAIDDGDFIEIKEYQY